MASHKIKKIYGYKYLLINILALGIVTAQPEARELVRNVYPGRCQNLDPLTTFEPCNRNSLLGIVAMECAAAEAMGKCRAGFNTDCFISETRAYSEYSKEFIGYRKCIGEARVHGYEPR